jgi:hypothetical protein
VGTIGKLNNDALAGMIVTLLFLAARDVVIANVYLDQVL